LEDHESTFDPNNVRDFLDQMIAEMKENQVDEGCHDIL
jgi:hypothetical protein